MATAWYNPAWRKRLKLTVDYTKVGAVLTNFPVYVSAASMPATLFTAAQANGADLRFTLGDGVTPLSHDLVHFVPATPAMELHVNAPSLSNVANTSLYLYYGNPAAGALTTAQKQGVWTGTGYTGAWHFGETGNCVDATGNAHTGAKHGVNPGNAGQLFAAGGQTFDGTSNYLSMTEIEMTGQFSFSTWAYVNFTSGNRGIFAGAANTSQFSVLSDSRYYYVRWPGLADWVTTHEASAFNGAWHHLVLTRDASNIPQLYRDGQPLLNTTARACTVGFAAIGISTDFWLGYLDEMRLQVGAALSAGWVSTEFANQSAPATFYSVGAEETSGGIGVRRHHSAFPGGNAIYPQGRGLPRWG